MADGDEAKGESQPNGSDRAADNPAPERAHETGGPKGPEPTRYGDWERKGRCIDF